MNPSSSPMHARLRARARPPESAWPTERGEHEIPGPAQITRTLIWLMRDRGMKSPDELCGVRRFHLEVQSLLKRTKRSIYPTFEASLAAAIDAGYIEAYEVDGEMLYLPNYKRSAA